MKKFSLVLAALLTGSFMLSAQLPNPLNLPDPLGLSRPKPIPPSPAPALQQPRPEEVRYKRHYHKKHPKRPYWKHGKRDH